MLWLIDLCGEVLKVFNRLVALMNTPINVLNDLFGTTDHPITFMTLLGFFLVDYILAMFALRIVRG